MTALDFAKGLLEQQRVAVVPGVAFGEEWGDYVRISYASSYENLNEAIARIAKYLATIPALR
jgi:aspartate/methionine/tyrosine aminotransferase